MTGPAPAPAPAPAPRPRRRGWPGRDREPAPDPLAEPAVPVRGRWIGLIALANLGLWMGYFGPLQVLLPLQVEAIDPAGKQVALGWVTGIGAAVAMIANPVAGALSDRTTSRFGRRLPWIAGGAAGGALALALLAGQRTVAGVALAWCLAQAGLNAMQAGLTAQVPDHVPVAQRGAVSGWIGIPQTLGVVLGVAVVTVVAGGRIGPGYLIIGALVAACAVPFALGTRDAVLPAAHRPPPEWRRFLARFWVDPRRHPDFAWAFATRFLVMLGNAMAVLYLLFFLTDAVRYEQVVGGDPEDGLLVLVVVYTLGVVASAVVGGVVSDRTGRRKPLVTASGLACAGPAVMLALWPSWPVAVAGAAWLGLAFGVYLAVDQALITQVLPAAGDRARDLGIINIANSGPQVLAPAIAAPIVAHLGGYTAMYLVVAALSVAGSVLVWKIRSVP